MVASILTFMGGVAFGFIICLFMVIMSMRG